MKKLKIVINGNKKLCGSVRVSGAKNAALPELAATILSAQESRFYNVPRVEDIKIMYNALRQMGADGDFSGNTVSLRLAEIKSPLAPREIVETTRASLLMLGPLLARHGHARVFSPGGCAIGDRNFDFHLEGLRLMGAEIHEDGGHIVASVRNRLKGVHYSFPGKTVTGTENLLMAAVLADGVSELRNCALEPEVGDLIDLLTGMGAKIEGKNSETLIITGQTSLFGAQHSIIPDRIEMGTYVIAGCLGYNEIMVENTIPDYIDALLAVLTEMGAEVATWDDKVTARASGLTLSPVSIATQPFPGYPTDLQAQLTTLLTQVEGRSRITENIFNNRFQHARELNKMGADIIIENNVAVIRGKTVLTGGDIRATDLRASAALVLAGLIADGRTVIENAYQLLRGYEDLPGKLQALGADITIIEE